MKTNFYFLKIGKAIGMKIIAVTIALFLGSFMTVNGQAPDNIPPDRVKVAPINDHLYLIQCTGGEEFHLPPFATNLIASLGPDGILLVDAALNATGPALHDTVMALVTRNKAGDKKIMINTHFHDDHTGGNHYLKNNMLSMIHQDGMNALSGKFFDLPGVPDPDCPIIGFSDSMRIHFNNEDIHIVPAPQTHSAGDVYVYFEQSKVVAAGDLFFSDEIPYVELGSGGREAGYQTQIRKFMNDFPDDVVFYPAHGRQYMRADFQKYDTMLTETVKLIRNAFIQGQDAETMIRNNILADWVSWRGQFPTTTLEAWIRTITWEVSHPNDGPPSICEPLTTALAKGQVSEAIKEYYSLKSARPNDFDFSEVNLNVLGYQLLARNRIDDACAIFKLNVDVFPNSGNVYDSYGEALLAKGDTTQAIINYKKSLENDPTNNNAVEVLKRIDPKQ
jgi:glyoxylase-like metal-dependent hydrolase (beta-lactamase superfamily II)